MVEENTYVATVASGLQWEDISDEAWREYEFPGGVVVRVLRPSELSVKRKTNGDSHRIKAFDITGTPVSHYIPAGWVRLSWTGKDGTHAFKF